MAHSFNAEKDKMVQKFKKKTWGLTRLIVTAQSYGEGEPKIQITRQRRRNEDEEDWKFSKTGRFNWEEIRWLAKVLKKAVVPWYEDYFAKHGE